MSDWRLEAPWVGDEDYGYRRYYKDEPEEEYNPEDEDR